MDLPIDPASASVSAARPLPLRRNASAAVNYAFIDRFQEIARAHFTIRRLEKRYGKDTVRAAYGELSGAARAAA
jgi:hypothetical protein